MPFKKYLLKMPKQSEKMSLKNVFKKMPKQSEIMSFKNA